MQYLDGSVIRSPKRAKFDENLPTTAHKSQAYETSFQASPKRTQAQSTTPLSSKLSSAKKAINQIIEELSSKKKTNTDAVGRVIDTNIQVNDWLAHNSNINGRRKQEFQVPYSNNQSGAHFDRQNQRSYPYNPQYQAHSQFYCDERLQTQSSKGDLNYNRFNEVPAQHIRTPSKSLNYQQKSTYIDQSQNQFNPIHIPSTAPQTYHQTPLNSSQSNPYNLLKEQQEKGRQLADKIARIEQSNKALRNLGNASPYSSYTNPYSSYSNQNHNKNSLIGKLGEDINDLIQENRELKERIRKAERGGNYQLFLEMENLKQQNNKLRRQTVQLLKS